MLFNLSLIFYFFAGVFFILRMVFDKKIIARLSIAFLFLAFIFHTLIIILRGIQLSAPPFMGMYNSLLIFAWCVAVSCVFFLRKYKVNIVKGTISLLIVLIFIYAAGQNKEVRPLFPALRSNWLILHVSSYMLGYGAISVSFISSFLYLILSFSKKTALLKNLEQLNYKFILLGFPFLTLGLTAGAVWANIAWGSFWSWDPKETWALINWLLYLLFLHLYRLKGLRGRAAAVVSLIAYTTVIFTFLGVSLFFKGLHSYT